MSQRAVASGQQPVVRKNRKSVCQLATGHWPLAVGVILALPETALAAESFPRGPGFYFDIVKIIFLLLVYFGWVRTASWVDQDAQELNLHTDLWNFLLLGGGVLSLVVVWMMPMFWLSLIAFILLFGAPALCYVNVRNQKVKPAERVLTEAHLRDLASRWLRFQFGKKESADNRAKVPVRFIGRSFNQKSEDPNRVAKAMESKGYKGALEMVYEATQRRATDIHLEPTKDEMTVRFRIDGMLSNADPFSRTMGDAVINIFKVLCNMDITEKRKPQDGSMSAQVEDHTIDFRVATAGSVAGEKLVMRILDKSQQIIDLSQLGMRDKMREQIRRLVTQPHGMFIVCGPTGAGKSTTLYACLNEIDRFQQNIITIENPVEYQLSNVTQIEVNPKAGKTFASELRSILRQDPDVIMIGEIRDQETAEIACQAAQTGHMVFTTLHANDTVTAVGRLIDLEVQPFMIGSALTAVLGQRLVRLLCPKCKVRYKPNPELLRKANLPADKIKFFYRPPERNDSETDGEAQEICSTCGGTGYYKRTGIFELFVITDKIRDLIKENPNINAIKQEAVKSGMHYLYEDGLRVVIEGRTSIQELLRVSK
jgi:type II secretory ATPase GspE/PulE/Tfp pilus assembly ATPase PilB-like protein